MRHVRIRPLAPYHPSSFLGCLICALACSTLACAALGGGDAGAEPSALVAERRTPAEPTTPAEHQAPSERTAPEPTLGVEDRGIFSDLDGRLQLALPAQLDPSQVHALYDAARGLLVLYEGTWPIKVYPVREHSRSVLELGSQRLGLRAGDHAELSPLLNSSNVHVLSPNTAPPPGDRDGDGIPDPLDVLLGAHKTALNGDRYDGRYELIAYPLGDVPRNIGVCTDVVIRALRNAGIDLQQAVHEDIRKAPKAYPSVSRPNPNIDHRRVKSLLPYFQRHLEAHAAAPNASDPYRPGDIVFMDTFPNRSGAEHIGIVSDQQNTAGVALIINNWTDGTVTTAMDLLGMVPVTHRFRVPPPVREVGPIPAQVSQLVVVLSNGFEDWHARLQRYERRPAEPFRSVGAPLSAVLGKAGYGWGNGLHGRGVPAGRRGPIKHEGDLRSPAGVFGLGTVHGYAASPGTLRLPYRHATLDQRCVDDPASPYYNQVVSMAETGERWRSAEIMRRDDDLYELALDIEHNRSPVRPGDGSCIFAHVWAGSDLPVSGCTALAKSDLRSLLEWLKPNAAWVALPEPEYRALRSEWGLP
jgi:uncharacterized protein YijF (DUF1287 family)